MPEIQKYSIVEKLREADQKLQGSPSLLGMTGLTYPNYVNAMRSNMFTHHLTQFLTLINPKFPGVFTNMENIVGENSSGYTKAKSDLKVFRKVVKYDEISDKGNVYYLFVYDEKENMYRVFERSECEDLSENFGFLYNNDVLDSYEEGDIIEKGTVLERASSYDEDMNYSYGADVTVAYTLEPFTSEDAAVASRSLQTKLAAIESDTIKICLNSNDYLINLYGNKKEYKPLPEIGDKVDDILAVSRRKFNNQLLYDFSDSSLREIHDGDSIYHIDKDVEIIDYTFFSNMEEVHDNPFYDQVNKYISAQDKFYQEIVDTIEEIMRSGAQYSNDIDYLYKRSLEMLDTEKKWKDGDSTYDLEIWVHFKRVSLLQKGCKITGRYGNKSVISEIREDEDMPFTDDGRRVDLLLNLLAIINRTTSFPLYELFINGSSYKIRMKMRTLDTLEEKEEMLFKYIGIFNKKQEKKFHSDYRKLNKKEKEKYIEDAIYDGIYIHQQPLWEEDDPIFYKIARVMEVFPFIHEDDLYIRKWGKKIKILTKYFVGDMYILRLKQSDRRGFSARSTGAIDTKSLPTRSFKSKSHLEKNSSSCIRFGEFETLNFSIGLITEDIALFHALYRTSIKGRRDLVRLMFDDEDGVQKLDSSYTSRVAEIFDVRLKSLGIGLEFIDDEDVIEPISNSNYEEHHYDGETYICSDYEFLQIQRRKEIRKELLEENTVMTGNELEDAVNYELSIREYLIGEPNETSEIDYSDEVTVEAMKKMRDTYLSDLNRKESSELVKSNK